MTHREIVAKEGWIFIFPLLVLAGLFYYFNCYIASSLLLLLAMFCIFFFRNPHREIPTAIGTVVSPADGRIMDIETLNEDHYLHGSAIRVRIFLSLFNVHINRMPIEGHIEWVEKVPGEFLPAYKNEAGSVNARNYIGFTSKWGKILVVQITGLVARRLVCWVKAGDRLTSGERFGLIRFGSCTELYLPVEAQILVQAGEKVKGGKTVIAKFYE